MSQASFGKSVKNHGHSNSALSHGSAAKGTGTAFYQSSLEKKLELLEARFSQPLVPQSPSEATLQPMSSPNWSKYNTHSNSQQSFGFDSPINKSQPVEKSSLSQSTGGGPLQKGTPDMFQVQPRSKRASSPTKDAVSSLEQVRKATDRHLQKVAAAQRFVVASSSCSEVSSESTRQVRNCKDEEAILSKEPQQPLLSTPTPSSPAVEQTKKRKSIPMKMEAPSIKENRENSNSATIRRSSGAQRKLKDYADNGSRKSNTAKKRLPKPTASSAPSENPAETSRQAILSPKKTSRSLVSPKLMSGEPSSSATENIPKRSTKTQRSLHNNAVIDDFFCPSIKTNKTKRQKTAQKKKAPVEAKESVTSFKYELQQSSTGTKPSKSLENKNATPASFASPSSAQLNKRIEELQRICKDQEEQLKAVANNRTILHTALQSALDQREKELKEANDHHAEFEARSRSCLEEFVREDANRAAREVREKLAADGARLGRIVYTRAGIRSPVETWEEGHAVRRLQSRQLELRKTRKQLEERYTLAQQIAQTFLDGEDTSDQAKQKELERLGGALIRSNMDALEAVESARYHLENMRRKERELAAEEQQLNDEKGAHIRALKRVASEDASRFRSSPKLHDRYILKSLLGKGGFSEVWQAFDLTELRDVAVKIHQLDPRWSESKKENYTKHVSREYEIHRNVRHPRIVSLYDVFEIDNNSFATVLELCQGTDLDALLKERRRLSERDARSILLQILSGMQYLSQPSEDGSRQGIIHYDLKPGNILFDELGDAKITDFGLSKIVEAPDPAESMELTSQGAGTYWFLPPECFITDETVRISNKVDVWSIGVIFYQMLFGRRPFGDGQSQDSILANQTMLNARQVSFPEKPVVSDDCKAFIRTCLSYDQAFRPTIAQLGQHSYVSMKKKS